MALMAPGQPAPAPARCAILRCSAPWSPRLLRTGETRPRPAPVAACSPQAAPTHPPTRARTHLFEVAQAVAIHQPPARRRAFAQRVRVAVAHHAACSAVALNGREVKQRAARCALRVAPPARQSITSRSRARVHRCSRGNGGRLGRRAGRRGWRLGRRGGRAAGLHSPALAHACRDRFARQRYQMCRRAEASRDAMSRARGATHICPSGAHSSPPDCTPIHY